MIHYFDTIAKHPFLVVLQMHPYQCSSLQYPPRIDKPAYLKRIEAVIVSVPPKFLFGSSYILTQ